MEEMSIAITSSSNNADHAIGWCAIGEEGQ
jgi:hypothetical protein